MRQDLQELLVSEDRLAPLAQAAELDLLVRLALPEDLVILVSQDLLDKEVVSSYNVSYTSTGVWVFN